MKHQSTITVHRAPCANPDCYWAIVSERPIGPQDLCDKCADREHDLVSMATANKSSENTREGDE